MSLTDIIRKPLTAVTPYDLTVNSITANKFVGPIVIQPPPVSTDPTDVFLLYNAASGDVVSRVPANVPGNAFSEYQVTAGGQTIPSGTASTDVYYTVSWSTVLNSDLHLAYDGTTHLFTAQVDGYYMITYSLAWSGSLTFGNWNTWISINNANGANLRNGLNSRFEPAGTLMGLPVAYNTFLGAGDSFGVFVFQNSTQTSLLQGTSADGLNVTQISIVRISPESLN